MGWHDNELLIPDPEVHFK